MIEKDNDINIYKLDRKNVWILLIVINTILLYILYFILHFYIYILHPLENVL